VKMARAGLLDIDGGHASLVRRGGRRAYGRWDWRGSGGGGGAENSSADLGRIRIAEQSRAEESRAEGRRVR
jgi:hypothetical protein